MNDEMGFEIFLNSAYDQALEKVTAALKQEGFGVLTKIDVQATMKEKLGADFRPYAILGACNPPLAHKALSSEAIVGLMLPCNVTVEANPTGQGSIVRIVNPKAMMQMGSLGENEALRDVSEQATLRLKRVAELLATE